MSNGPRAQKGTDNAALEATIAAKTTTTAVVTTATMTATAKTKTTTKTRGLDDEEGLRRVIRDYDEK